MKPQVYIVVVALYLCYCIFEILRAHTSSVINEYESLLYTQLNKNIDILSKSNLNSYVQYINAIFRNRAHEIKFWNVVIGFLNLPFGILTDVKLYRGLPKRKI